MCHHTLGQVDPEYDSTMDSNPLERERGITIFAKVCAAAASRGVGRAHPRPLHGRKGKGVRRCCGARSCVQVAGPCSCDCDCDCDVAGEHNGWKEGEGGGDDKWFGPRARPPPPSCPALRCRR
jgi:hypothetical protein